MIWPYRYTAGLVLFLSLRSILLVDSTTPKKPLINAKLLNSKIDVKRTYKVGLEEKYTSVQAAIDAVPEGNSQWVVVHVKAGTYRYIFLSVI
jgi:pectin methylesterase-like acyl-CoA thioesterase